MADEPGGADPHSKLILVVDDDEGQRDLLKYLATKEGFRVEAAGSGADALAKVKQLNPDLILLDLMLPGMGGYEIVRELQASGNGDIPVLIASARNMDDKMISTLTNEPNVKGFFAKPPHAAKFRDKVHGLLGTKAPPKPKDAWGSGN
jgi:CheY-like chemotaxis protein